ncbi:DUF1315 family protein [Pseudohongiella sp. SYSU M77423]|jgi:uncharacterized protein|uniref:YeaC family protein n=1 Tax=unclassified Pseudohongiella TaxID=2629611 RepID=UPI000C90C997|nr:MULTISPECIES: DUF1315 family protein [unclassified Pseudohongiella]MAY56100.1 hypothetical protein [Gammaproteobacteria bacterium]MDH7945129.1 DUF1315 family protein [Pseudohongiella sp. SYSU M77423]MEC8860813.1 DUF1315 family protein [Pseudomonadota bacterium]HBX35784.1 DUF1315 domain-containing protein [Pseudohongiella sp.]|tara:strand:- start:104 stop:400 length:297 start_codon:yes stop_codon:yes gene_type:complete
MSDNSIQSIQDILAMMTPEVHENLKTAVELGKWPDGRKLTAEQLEYCLQAIIAYEQHLPEEARVGYIDRTGLKKSHCDDDDASKPAPVTILPPGTTRH